MQEALETLWVERDEDLPFKRMDDAVVLASIVEKETGLHAERPLVAAVFINRLRKGMRLQSDPTVVYALTEGKGELDRALTRQDWKIESSYNTYRINGLPPVPSPIRAWLLCRRCFTRQKRKTSILWQMERADMCLPKP